MAALASTSSRQLFIPGYLRNRPNSCIGPSASATAPATMCGVAVLSCTDCSGSSTTSDITDPGSPFSVTSSHSEDSSGSKMTPTQSAHHPPWSWTEEANPPPKRPTDEKEALEKRLKIDGEKKENASSPTCLNILVNSTRSHAQILPKENASLSNNYNNNNNNKVTKHSGKKKVEVAIAPKMQQGKITEYFKSSAKTTSNQLKSKKNNLNKGRNKITPSVSSIPRKILPAPSKIPVASSINNFINHPAVTLTAVAFPPNLTYLHAKAPKPPDNIFVPQFTTIDNRCLNIIQPFNNFNSCVKLNATVVPIVKLPSRINGSNFSVLNLPKQQQQQPSIQPPSLSLSTAAHHPSSSIHHQTLKTQTSSEAASEACSEASSIETSSLDTASTTILTPEVAVTGGSLGPATPDSSDSGISSSSNTLEISVNDEHVSEAQKSPILSQPKTIRFPAKQQPPNTKEKRTHSSDQVVCHWAKCQALFDASGALLEHLQLVHVVPQPAQEEQYVCLWVGCKVHGRKSCSRSWLERHVLAHAGTKPFRCIVDGCGMRFNSQLSLERHVNNHFNTDGNQNGSGKKQVDNNSAKLFKRNGKKLRFRRQPWSARMFDFIDSGIMEGLQHRLLMLTEKRTLGQFENAPGDTLTLQSQILARRIEADGQKKVLLRWHPQNIVPDEWVNESNFQQTKYMSIPNLECSAKVELSPFLFKEPTESLQSRRKHRRKPCKAVT
ncbi:uncharacterized protein [Onthophagus taurus]|uniref:uncharacterized protein isoform X2 n=1 Tax=Onthophagus taurus TaxID=166361 RepID=UPI000C2093EC|nr:uncharacterized protein LOC111414539 isoform X2 [Onthophagus taurus]